MNKLSQLSTDDISIITTWLKRYSPQYRESKIHCCNQFNQIMEACKAMRQGTAFYMYPFYRNYLKC